MMMYWFVEGIINFFFLFIDFFIFLFFPSFLLSEKNEKEKENYD